MDGVGASSSRFLVGVDTELVMLDGGASDSEGVVGGEDIPIISYKVTSAGTWQRMM